MLCMNSLWDAPRPASGRERSPPPAVTASPALSVSRGWRDGTELRQAGHRGGTSVAHTPSSAPGRGGAGHRSAASRSGPLGFSSFPGATSARGGGGDAVGVALGCWGCRRLRDVCRLARGPRPPREAKARAQGLPRRAESWKPRIHCAQTAPPPPTRASLRSLGGPGLHRCVYSARPCGAPVPLTETGGRP